KPQHVLRRSAPAVDEDHGRPGLLKGLSGGDHGCFPVRMAVLIHDDGRPPSLAGKGLSGTIPASLPLALGEFLPSGRPFSLAFPNPLPAPERRDQLMLC